MTRLSARDNILSRIRAAQGRRGPVTDGERALVREYLAAHPAGPKPPQDWEAVARFRERCVALTTTVDEVASIAEAPAAIARYLREGRLPLAAVVWPELSGLDWTAAGIAAEARGARGDDLVGITGCFCAIAETGTLMMLSGPDTPSTASLLPETHVAMVPNSRIVRDMEAAWALLRAERGTLPRAVTFISGPSRTADIEQTVTLGAHGPYRVHVVLTA